MTTQQLKVQLRNDWQIKPEALQLNGKVFDFIPMHDLTEDDTSLYVGEVAMMAVDPTYPADAPSWIASGDLVTV